MAQERFKGRRGVLGRVTLKRERRREMAMFSGCKIGDKVWDLRYGWGKVVKIIIPYLQVEFPHGNKESYHVNGKPSDPSINPTLFWDEVTIVAPAKPSKKEKPKEHEHNWQIIEDLTKSWEECDCGEKRRFNDFRRCEKEKSKVEECEACDWINRYSQLSVYEDSVIFLLNQHHVEGCEKKGGKG